MEQIGGGEAVAVADILKRFQLRSNASRAERCIKPLGLRVGNDRIVGPMHEHQIRMALRCVYKRMKIQPQAVAGAGDIASGNDQRQSAEYRQQGSLHHPLLKQISSCSNSISRNSSSSQLRFDLLQ